MEPLKPPRPAVARTDPAFVNETNVIGFRIGDAEPNKERIGTPVPGVAGYFVRYARGAYDLAARMEDLGGAPDWLAVCRHGNSAGADKLMGPEGVEKVAAARKTWCADCAAGSPAPEPAPAPQKPRRGRSPKATTSTATRGTEKAAPTKVTPLSSRRRAPKTA
jgi:hypothetical protein